MGCRSLRNWRGASSVWRHLWMGLPTAPPKPTDRRSFTGETVQCEAIAPDVLSDILRAAIEERRDSAATDDVLRREADMRADLLEKLKDMA